MVTGNSVTGFADLHSPYVIWNLTNRAGSGPAGPMRAFIAYSFQKISGKPAKSIILTGNPDFLQISTSTYSDRKCVVEGKSVSVRRALVGRPNIKKKKTKKE